MIIPILVILLSNLLAFLGRNGRKYCLEASFFILFLFIGFRYDYGNDTMQYAKIFKEIASHDYSLNDFFSIISSYPYEPGWVLLNYLFKPFGWFSLQIVLSAIETWVIYNCTKKYVPKEYSWLSVAIFTLSQTFMWIGACSMFRQWLACIIFLYSVRFILNRRLIPFLLLNIVGALFHKSAFIILPTYFFIYLNIGFLKKRTTVVVIMILICLWYFYAGDYFNQIDMLLSDSEDFASYLSNYKESNDINYSLIGFIAAFAMPTFALFNISNINKSYVPLVFISICSILVTPLTGYLMMIGRLTTYFTIVNIILYPIILSNFIQKRPDLKNVNTIMILIILLPLIRSMIDFMGGNNVWSVHYSNYQTIFSQVWQ